MVQTYPQGDTAKEPGGEEIEVQAAKSRDRNNAIADMHMKMFWKTCFPIVKRTFKPSDFLPRAFVVEL